MDNKKEIQSFPEKRQTGIREAVKKRTISYIVAAFGLVAGLAWNEAIKSLIEYVFPTVGNSVVAKVFYAVALTIVLVVVSMYLTKHKEKEEK